VSHNGKEDVLPLDEAVVLLAEAEEERQTVDRELREILNMLGLGKAE
jgi:type I restriction enzyme M protein